MVYNKIFSMFAAGNYAVMVPAIARLYIGYEIINCFHNYR